MEECAMEAELTSCPTRCPTVACQLSPAQTFSGAYRCGAYFLESILEGHNLRGQGTSEGAMEASGCFSSRTTTPSMPMGFWLKEKKGAQGFEIGNQENNCGQKEKRQHLMR